MSSAARAARKGAAVKQEHVLNILRYTCTSGTGSETYGGTVLITMASATAVVCTAKGETTGEATAVGMPIPHSQPACVPVVRQGHNCPGSGPSSKSFVDSPLVQVGCVGGQMLLMSQGAACRPKAVKGLTSLGAMPVLRRRSSTIV